MQIICDGSDIFLAEGDFAIVNPLVSHELLSCDSNGCTALFVIVSSAQLDALDLNRLRFDNPVVKGDDPLMKEIKNHLFEITDSFLSGRESDRLLSYSIGIRLLSILMKNLPHHFADGRTGDIKSSDERIIKTCEYLDANHSRKISLDELSKHVYVSPQYLSSIFKEAMGMTIREYIQKDRFFHALNLIDCTEKPLVEICSGAGFSSYRYMERCFAEMFGCTPDEYRKRSKGHAHLVPDQNSSLDEYIFGREETLAIIQKLKS